MLLRRSPQNVRCEAQPQAKRCVEGSAGELSDVDNGFYRAVRRQYAEVEEYASALSPSSETAVYEPGNVRIYELPS